MAVSVGAEEEGKVVEVAPEIFVHPDVPFADRCHWYVLVPMPPLAAADDVNEGAEPVTIV